MAFTERERELILRLDAELEHGAAARRRRIASWWWRVRAPVQWLALLAGLALMVLAVGVSVPVSFGGALLAAGAAHARMGHFERDRFRLRVARFWRKLGLDG